MSLQSLQQHMMGYLLDSAKNKRSAHLPELQALVSSDSPPEGLQIYSYAYRSRLIEVLGSDHEKLTIFLGAKEFDRLAGEFVATHPSQVRSLRHYGARLPEFLQASDHPEAARAAQLCHFERTLLDVYDSPSDDQLNPDTLQALAPEAWPTLTLTPHSSLRIFVDETTAIPVWQICNQAKKQPWPVSDGAGEPWALWRDRSRVCQFRHMEKTECAAMQAMLIEQKSLAEAAEDLIELVAAESLAPLLQGWLQQWFVDGLVSQISND